MPNAIVSGLILILGLSSSVGFAQTLPDSGQSPTTAPSDVVISDELAKAHYDNQILQAKHDYLRAVIKADETYVANLDETIKQAMSNQDLELAERLNKARRQAAADKEKHETILSDLNSGDAAPSPEPSGVDLKGYRLVSAVWTLQEYGRRRMGWRNGPSIDVTERIKPILVANTGDTVATYELFGDPGPYRTKLLIITYLRPNGLTAERDVIENDFIPKFDLPWDIQETPPVEPDSVSIP